MKIIKLEEVLRENTNIHISLRMSGTVISVFNCQHNVLANLNINEEKKRVFTSGNGA